ncbi:Co2+/Mg2+ efflux protein ApaG [Maricaulaceae bacterium MS644]
MYVEETQGVVIRVQPSFLAEDSDPDEGRYVWAYTVEIENTGEQAVRLLSREWRITDAMNRTEIVRGDGVVGEQPHLEPGERFSYTSGAPLTTPSGFMTGAYLMERADGVRFDAAVPAFALDTPGGGPRASGAVH